MKRVFLILVAALATLIPALSSGTPAGADPHAQCIAAGDVPIDWSAGATLPSPYYGTYLDQVSYCVSADGRHDYLFAADTTGADYGGHPSTWRYPTPGIPADWLETTLLAWQYSDNGSTGAGNCAVSTVVSPNLAGHYTTQPAGGSYGYTTMCAHRYIRAVFVHKWNPGGFGWQSKSIYSQWFFNDACTNGTVCP